MAVDVLVINLDGLEVIADNFTAPVLAGTLAGVVGFEFAVAQVNAVDKETQVGAEGKDLFALEGVFVGEFLHHRENVLVEQQVVVDDAVAGVEQVEFFTLPGDGAVFVEKQGGIAAGGNPFLDQGNHIGQELLAVTAVFAQQVVIRVSVHLRLGDEGFEVFFDDQRIADRVGFDFLVAECVFEKRHQEFLL